MDYSVSSYLPPVTSTLIGVAAGLDPQQHFSVNSSPVCHFHSSQQESRNSPVAEQEQCSGPLSSSLSIVPPLLVPTSTSFDSGASSYGPTALLHHSHLLLQRHQQQNYTADELLGSSGASPSTASLASPFHLYGSRHHGGTSTDGLSSLSFMFGDTNNIEGRSQSSTTSSLSSSANNNTSSLAAAAATLFGSNGFHGNRFTSISNPSSRPSSITTSNSHFASDSSFFSPNGIHLQG